MTEGGTGYVDWNNPLPGNVHALTGEVERFENVRDQCYEIARVLRGLSFDNWTGRAHAAFDDFRRTRLAKQWEEVGDAHDGAARNLAEHRDTLSTLQPLARYAAERTRYDSAYPQAVAAADILRWQEQVAAAAQRTAAALHEVADQLNALRPPLKADPVPEVSPPVGARPPEQKAASAAIVDKARSFGRHQSPAELHDEVVLLCDALLDADFVSESEL